MANNKYVNYPEIGDVLFEKSRKAKRVIISVKSPSNIRVAVPRFITIKRAESFVLQKLNWISKQQCKCLKKINITQITKSASSEEKLRIKKQVEYLANKYGFTFRKITLRNMRTRWGSCTAQNNISLNIGLVALTDDLKNYIILHELVHTKIKNHRKEFWEELSNFIPNPKALNRKLSQNYGLFEI
jgi:predicted metal-dependent hydrolase